MRFNIAVLPGDGIGPEIVEEAVKTLKSVERRFGHEFTLHHGDIGGIAIDKYGVSLPEDTTETCRRSQAILLGAVGGPKWDDPRAKDRPEQGLLTLRKDFDLFANLRPAKVFPMLIDTSPVKPELLKGVDLMMVRELTGGLYFGKPKKQWKTSRGRRAVDTLTYTEQAIERILRVGFELARTRRKKLTSVDKANVLESSRLWRQIAMELAPQYPDVELEHMLVDACSMQLIRRPSTFDVVVTENTFGDILTDEASVLVGSMGLMPSATIAWGEGALGLYEPIHGSAPKYAGQNRVNPIATILSVAMMLRYSFGLVEEAEVVEKAVESVLEEGYRTPDIMQEGMKPVGTREMGTLIAAKVGGGE